MKFQVGLGKEQFKFSSAHFTVFSPGHAERLHGHNYKVRATFTVDAASVRGGISFDFNEVKPILCDLCRELDERVLLPVDSALVKISSKGRNTHVSVAGRGYVFPSEEVQLLKVSNISAEELSRWLATEFLRRAPEAVTDITERLRLTVEETDRQWVACCLDRKDIDQILSKKKGDGKLDER